MVILKSTILAFSIALFSLFHPPVGSAGDAGPVFRIGLIGADPRQLVQDFDPLLDYLKNNLRHSGIRNVTVFVARDMNQIRIGIQKGNLDFILASAYPAIELEGQELLPALVAVQGQSREYAAVFFVRNKSPLASLDDLRGKTLVFGTPWSTAAYALAKSELYRNELSLSESTDKAAPDDAVRYVFAGEPINQVFRVIRGREDAGVFGSSDWDELSPTAQSALRIIHRTAPALRLLGSFHPLFPPGLREAVEQELVAMSGNSTGRTALAKALNITAFERLTDADRNALARLCTQLSDGTE